MINRLDIIKEQLLKLTYSIKDKNKNQILFSNDIVLDYEINSIYPLHGKTKDNRFY